MTRTITQSSNWMPQGFITNGAELCLVTELSCSDSSPSWLLGDHLGSTSTVADAGGQIISELRYSAFGEIRYQSGTLTTNYLYTGQRQEAEIGMYYYVARWYDPAIGRFIQADSIVPNPGTAAGFDRYNYSWNNPIKLSDPSGHSPTIYMDGEQLAYMDNSFSSHISTTSSQYNATWKPPRRQPNKPWEGHEIWPDDEYLFGKTPENFYMTNEEIFLAGFQSPLGYPYNYGGFGANNTRGGTGYHPGIDSRNVYDSNGNLLIRINELGRSIYNVYDGIVTNTGNYGPGFGNYVVVEHNVYGGKYYSLYAHLDSIDVNVGDRVSAGAKIGELGNSGTGDPHLHYEVRKENNISIGSGEPFQGHIYWPGSYAEFIKYFVDLGQLRYVTNEGFGQ